LQVLKMMKKYMEIVGWIVDKIVIDNPEYDRGESWDADRMLFMEDDL